MVAASVVAAAVVVVAIAVVAAAVAATGVIVAAAVNAAAAATAANNRPPFPLCQLFEAGLASGLFYWLEVQRARNRFSHAGSGKGEGR